MATILVTGANRGIGYAIAQAIGTRLPDSTILLGCRSVDAGEQAISQLRTDGVAAKLDTVQVDIEDDSSIAAAVEMVGKVFGKLDGGFISCSVRL